MTGDQTPPPPPAPPPPPPANPDSDRKIGLATAGYFLVVLGGMVGIPALYLTQDVWSYRIESERLEWDPDLPGPAPEMMGDLENLEGFIHVSVEQGCLHGPAEFRSKATGLLKGRQFYRNGDLTRFTMWDDGGRIVMQYASNRQGFSIQRSPPWSWGEDDQVAP